MPFCFSLVTKKKFSEKNKISSLNNPKFCRKTLFFGIEKFKWVDEYIKKVKKRTDVAIQTRHLRVPNRNNALTLVLFKVLTALQENLRFMCNFRKRKKTPTAELNIPLSRNFFD